MHADIYVQTDNRVYMIGYGFQAEDQLIACMVHYIDVEFSTPFKVEAFCVFFLNELFGKADFDVMCTGCDFIKHL